jgi:hypothetical protein
MNNRKIAFVTSSSTPGITQDDQLLSAELEKLGLDCISAPWDEGGIDWNEFDMILFRSCWNYHLKPKKFNEWIRSLPEGKTVNSTSLIAWNLNKKYLKDLERSGVFLPETEFLERDTFYPQQLSDILLKRNWSKAVLKPCISASSFKTEVVTNENALQVGQQLVDTLTSDGMILQRFQDEVVSKGELSIIFFNGHFSHALIKRAKPNEFRVQKEFGGTHALISPPTELIEQARHILTHLPEVPSYARVDGIDVGGTFVLMELELIEPVLFFASANASATKLADVLIAKLNSETPVTSRRLF